MSRRCLRHEVADLVDGRLSAWATEQAHAHLASCGQCRSAVIAQREASARLRSMRTVAPTADFMQRLTSIPMTDPAASGAASVSRAALPVQNSPSVVSLDSYREQRAPSLRAKSAKKAGITAISVAGLVSVAAWVGVSGSQVAVSVPNAQQVSVAPMITTFSQVHRQATQGMPFAGATYVDATYQTAPHYLSHLVP